MGLFSRSKPKIKVQTTKKDGYSGWIKCSSCKELIHVNELEKNINCCPKCSYHYRLPARARIKALSDSDTFEELFTHLTPSDPLNFIDSKPYPERIRQAKITSTSNEAVITGICQLEELPIALGVMDFSFMAGSMGSVVGEKITLLIEHAIDKKLPLILVCASGGARMQESALSLMQMAKTSAAIAKLSESKLPYISILTNPTTGGVTASFAALGDLIIAEPRALVCFAGPRVIEQTTGHTLPEEAQKSEFLLQHGMIDAVVQRAELKEQVSTYLRFLIGNQRIYTSSKEEIIDKKLKELMDIPDHD